MLTATNNRTISLWRRLLAHMNEYDLRKVHQNVDRVPKNQRMEEVCRPCRLEKAHKFPFVGKFERATNVGDNVHAKIIGPSVPSFRKPFRYASVFVDEDSRYAVLGFMVHRSKIGKVFLGVKEKLKKLEGEHEHIQKLHSDTAEKYIDLKSDSTNDLKEVFVSTLYTTGHNGIAERLNRTTVEAARALPDQASLPECLWSYKLKQII